MADERSLILLYKPQYQRMYLRKWSSTYHDYHALMIVNKQNQVIELGWRISDLRIIGDHVKDYVELILGKSKAKKHKEGDEYRLLNIISPLKLDKPFQLDKPVRGIRYASKEEDYALKKEIIKTIANEYNITPEDMFWNWGKYPELYKLSMMIEFQDILFDLEKSGELYPKKKKAIKSNYKPIGTSGQTKLF